MIAPILAAVGLFLISFAAAVIVGIWLKRKQRHADVVQRVREWPVYGVMAR
jgi:hypothetical protein